MKHQEGGKKQGRNAKTEGGQISDFPRKKGKIGDLYIGYQKNIVLKWNVKDFTDAVYDGGKRDPLWETSFYQRRKDPDKEPEQYSHYKGTVSHASEISKTRIAKRKAYGQDPKRCLQIMGI